MWTFTSPEKFPLIVRQVMLINQRFLRNGGQRPSSILDEYANLYRPEVASELEHLAVQTAKNKSLQISYEIEEQRKRQRTIRYHILRRKYVAHPNDIHVDLNVKNHMQFLHRNYPKRWTVKMLAESFDQSKENVRLILQQRTTRGMRVRARSPTSLFGVRDEDEREKIIRDHMIKRDLQHGKSKEDDGEPVDYQVLAEESNLIPRRRPSDAYLKRDNDGFFSNVISSSDENQQTERDISMEKRKLLTSSSTLLDRVNKLRLSGPASSDTFSSTRTSSALDDERLTILQKMRQTNDAIVEANERRQKFLQRLPTKKIK